MTSDNIFWEVLEGKVLAWLPILIRLFQRKHNNVWNLYKVNNKAKTIPTTFCYMEIACSMAKLSHLSSMLSSYVTLLVDLYTKSICWFQYYGIIIPKYLPFSNLTFLRLSDAERKTRHKQINLFFKIYFASSPAPIFHTPCLKMVKHQLSKGMNQKLSNWSNSWQVQRDITFCSSFHHPSHLIMIYQLIMLLLQNVK